MIVESLVGGLFGGLLRLAPEVLKFFDRKNARQHEIQMFGMEIDLVKSKMASEMHMADARVAVHTLDAMSEALKEQGQTARAAGRIVAGISALVRPIVTYWFVALYSAVKISAMVIAYSTGEQLPYIILNSWTEQDMGIFSMILGFWFIGRVWERANKS